MLPSLSNLSCIQVDRSSSFRAARWDATFCSSVFLGSRIYPANQQPLQSLLLMCLVAAVATWASAAAEIEVVCVAYHMAFIYLPQFLSCFGLLAFPLFCIETVLLLPNVATPRACLPSKLCIHSFYMTWLSYHKSAVYSA
ncbi:hypothetical protein B0T21DRAFT_373315 [Apiosordaria backusii]|uniref:Uncharacterized protein n=1 Tax=Apiosordaria backusii TaxID=314023 RepID=A0AA40ASM7_9PEZI|nr:hypothetical protein B0T21DRAFT_373315 [Apiosordaria backusii]